MLHTQERADRLYRIQKDISFNESNIKSQGLIFKKALFPILVKF